MSIYIDIKNNIVVPKQRKRYIWPFETHPQLPIIECGTVEEPGWDIPIRIAKDSSSQWWEDNGHGGPLMKVRKKPYTGQEVRYTEIIKAEKEKVIDANKIPTLELDRSHNVRDKRKSDKDC